MNAALEVRRRVNPGLNWNCWRSAPLVIPTVLIVFLAAFGKLTLATALAANFVGLLAPLALLLSRFRPHENRFGPSLATLRLMFPYAWRTASMVMAASLTYRLDQVLLVAIVPSADLGLYAVAVMVALITNPLTSGLSVALFGHLRGEQSEERALARFRQSLKVTFLLSASVAVILAIFAPVVLRVVFGSQFSPATTALRLLLPGAVAFDLQGVITTKLLSDGRPGETSRAALIGAAITVGGLLTLAPRYGINGAAVVTSVAWTSQILFLIGRGALHSHPARPAMVGVLDDVAPPPAI
ncbi:MAG TPA: oligosaccharide flippase family protein, partial [Acidimicrobiales bacterium]|nr:oligosaccharide flippase family protein [Acidimicrobiales bacterium]